MQDIHSISTGNGGGDGSGGGGGRLFGGFSASNGGDRRLRPHNHHHHHTPQAMKCPRCESLNTKFCYYNNYNLSQPRHFCKSCRRYWTKGGVLRNVPVGGGCRKTKRSKSKTNSSHNSSSHSDVRKSSTSQNSSSDSSSLTEKTTKSTNPVFNFHEKTTTTTITATTTATGFVNIPNSVNPLTQNPSFNPPFLSENNHNNALFPEISSFTNLITSSSASQIGFHDILPFRSPNQAEIGEELKIEIPLGGFTEDWNHATDEALFDLTGAVDQSYWNQDEWNDHDHNQGDEHQLNYLR